MEVINRSVLVPAWVCVWMRFHENLIRVEEISKKRGISMAQVSLAWSLTRVTAPVIGSTSIKNLEELIGALHWPFCGVVMVISSLLAGATDIKLTEDEILYLEEPYKARSVFGHA